ncbi:hypothetical protein ACROYT_G011131 [Oculina patagonica]
MAVKETMDHSDPYLTALNSFIYNKGPAKMLTDFVQGIATHVMANIAKQGLKLSPAVYRVLGVGSGQGDSDLRILSAVATAIGSSQTKRPAIHSVIIEPNETLMKEFKTSVSSLPEPLKSLAYVSFEWHQMTFEKFTESFPKIESFDMIHFVASLYYMDAKTSLNRCYQMLSCGGAIFCTVGPEDSFFPKLSRKLNEKVDLGAIHKLYTEVDLVNIAEKNNWKYEELWRTHCTVDISSCFDESSKEGSSLLDFLTHKQEFRTTADKAFYKKNTALSSDEARICVKHLHGVDDIRADEAIEYNRTIVQSDEAIEYNRTIVQSSKCGTGSILLYNVTKSRRAQSSVQTSINDTHNNYDSKLIKRYERDVRVVAGKNGDRSYSVAMISTNAEKSQAVKKAKSNRKRDRKPSQISVRTVTKLLRRKKYRRTVPQLSLSLNFELFAQEKGEISVDTKNYPSFQALLERIPLIADYY